MASFTHIPFRNFLHNVLSSFQETSNENMEEDSVVEAETNKKFQVSKQDLKLISSALLFYKKNLLKQNQLEKAKRVSDVDNRIYQLIIDLEQEKKKQEELV